MFLLALLKALLNRVSRFIKRWFLIIYTSSAIFIVFFLICTNTMKMPFILIFVKIFAFFFINWCNFIYWLITSPFTIIPVIFSYIPSILFFIYALAILTLVYSLTLLLLVLGIFILMLDSFLFILEFLYKNSDNLIPLFKLFIIYMYELLVNINMEFIHAKGIKAINIFYEVISEIEMLVLSFDFFQPILKFIAKILVYCWIRLEFAWWFLTNSLKFIVVIFIQLITFILRAIAPLDSGDDLEPYPDLEDLLLSIDQRDYFADFHADFFMIWGLTFYDQINIFYYLKVISEMSFSDINMKTFKTYYFNYMYLLMELNRLTWVEFFSYTLGAYVSFIYLYVHLGRIAYYMGALLLFFMWFFYKGMMEHQVEERVNEYGRTEFFLDTFRIVCHKIGSYINFKFLAFFISLGLILILLFYY